MLKLYTEIKDLNTIKRKYLVDVLKPLLPEKNFNKYDIKSVSDAITKASHNNWDTKKIVKNAEKYSAEVFDKAVKEAKGGKTMLMGFLTGDVAARYSLKKSIDLEKISNRTISSGIVFCPYNINDLVGANIVELFELINEHDKVFVLKKNEVYELNLNKTNHLKLLLY